MPNNSLNFQFILNSLNPYVERLIGLYLRQVNNQFILISCLGACNWGEV